MANDAHEEFWGCTITKDKKEYLWDPSAESEEDVEHKLQLTSACLGHKAKDGERNLLEVTTEDDEGKRISCSLVSLRVGGKECVHLDIGFFNATKFTLKEGSGPVSLCGVHLRALPLDFDENADSSEDEEVPDLIPAKLETKKIAKPAETNKKIEKKVEEKKPASPAKRPLPTDKKNEKPAKKAKVVELPEDSDEEDDEEEDDQSDDEELSENSDTPSLLDNEAEEGSDEDSEEGDDEPEGDDVDSDEDEDMDSADDEDESDDEEEEEEEKQVKKSSKVNGHTPKATPGKGGPQKNKDKAAVAEVKTPTAKKTPGKKDTTTTPKSQAKKTPEELKAFLLKSPNLPKKFDKFANFMKNNMKVTDEKSQKDFWEYVQKNKK